MVSIIAGLQLIEDFITPNEQAELLASIDAQNWLTDLKRRVQHYGYRYDYRSRAVDASQFLGDLPHWSNFLIERLQPFFGKLPDQLIVNEYLPGQGIAAHVDCVPCFGDTVVSLSLLSACVMDFSQPSSKTNLSLLLKPCSLLVLQKEARYAYKHAIASRKTDQYDGLLIERSRRISLTFRTVLQK